MGFYKGMGRFRIVVVLNILVALGGILSYLATYIPPHTFWPAGLVAMAFPFVLLLNCFFVLFWLLKHPALSSISILVFIVGVPMIGATVSLHPSLTDEKGQFKVLSYNVSAFNAWGRYQEQMGLDNAYKLVRWVESSDADILCLQEFYNNDRSDTFNTISKIRQSGKEYFYMAPVYQEKTMNGYFGVAIFSKYPILARGEVLTGERHETNKAIYADLLLEGDTIRVYNMHLESMTIDERSLFRAGSFEELKQNYKTVLRKLRNGVKARSRQAQVLLAHIDRSPYKVIVCGDMNDMPYTFTYHALKSKLDNAFEKAGRGLGFTYNGKLFFLRIDNQFYSNDIRVHRFKTHRSVPYSEHYPISASYSLQ